jgi:thymidylate kinase
MSEHLSSPFNPLELETVFYHVFILDQSYRQNTREVVNFYQENQKFSPHSHLIVFEGNDGTGKTTLSIRFAQHLRNQGVEKVIVLRGSGTTGMEELILDAQRAGVDNETLERMKAIEKLQNDYRNPDISFEKKIEIAQRMQLEMLALINDCLTQGYVVISDRGIFSALLGIQEKAPEGWKAIVENILSTLEVIPVGSLNILIDAPPEITLPRVLEKDGITAEDIQTIAFEQMKRRKQWLQVAKQLPDIFATINACGKIDEVFQKLIENPKVAEWINALKNELIQR